MRAALRSATVALLAACVTAGVISVTTAAEDADSEPPPPTTTTTTIPKPIEQADMVVELNCDRETSAVLASVNLQEAKLYTPLLTRILAYPVGMIDRSLCLQGREESGEPESSGHDEREVWPPSLDQNAAPTIAAGEESAFVVQLMVGPFEAKQTACGALYEIRERVERAVSDPLSLGVPEGAANALEVLNDKWYVGRAGQHDSPMDGLDVPVSECLSGASGADDPQAQQTGDPSGQEGSSDGDPRATSSTSIPTTSSPAPAPERSGASENGAAESDGSSDNSDSGNGNQQQLEAESGSGS